MKKVHLIVSGRVQGVGFRYSTYALALELGDIYGRVWNNDDGRIHLADRRIFLCCSNDAGYTK